MMRVRGGKVNLVVFKDADHFLFFTHEETVLARPEVWLGARTGGILAASGR